MVAINTRKLALWISGPFGFSIPAYYAYDVWTMNIQETPNLATWVMILTLDVVTLWMVVAEGNKRPYTQAGWAVAAVLVNTAILSRSHVWHFGPVEIWSIALCLIATFLWQLLKNVMGKERLGMFVGFFLQALAICVSVAPQAYDYWYKPDPNSAYLWSLSSVGCLVGIYAAEKQTMANTFILWVVLFINLSVWFLTTR